jgi:hypothetical protein
VLEATQALLGERAVAVVGAHDLDAELDLAGDLGPGAVAGRRSRRR